MTGEETDDRQRLEYISLFSGAGGLDLGFHRAGHRAVAFCESDPYRRRVLARHWPDTPCAEDVREFDARWLRRHGRTRKVGGLIGGFPCQDLSVAGKRRGLAGKRSSLFFEFARVADELVVAGGWILVENVPGLLSGCSCVGCEKCGDLLRLHSRGWRESGLHARRNGSQLGFDLGTADGDALAGGNGGGRGSGNGAGRCPCRRCDEARRLLAAHNGTEFHVVRDVLLNIGFRDLAWRVLDSRYFGVPQRRRRIFILARRAGGRRAAEVLLEPDGGGGDFAPGAEPGARVAASLAKGSSGAGGPRVGAEEAAGGHLVAEGFGDAEDGVARTLKADAGDRWKGADHDTYVAATVRSHPRPTSDNAGGVVSGPILARSGRGPNTTVDEGALIADGDFGEPESGGQGDAVHPAADERGWQARAGLPGDPVGGGGEEADPDGVREAAGDARRLDLGAAVSIHPDAIGRSGDATSESVDGAGAVRRRDPGLGVSDDGTAHTLNTGAPPGVFNLRGREDGAQAEPAEEASLRASSGGSSRSYLYGDPEAIAYDDRNQAVSDVHHTLRGEAVGQRVADAILGGGAEGDRCANDPQPDGPRYAACGDAVTVNVARWIGERLAVLG